MLPTATASNARLCFFLVLGGAGAGALRREKYPIGEPVLAAGRASARSRELMRSMVQTSHAAGTLNTCGGYDNVGIWVSHLTRMVQLLSQTARCQTSLLCRC